MFAALAGHFFVLYPGLAAAVMLATCMITQDSTNNYNLISPQEIIIELLCLKLGTMIHFPSGAYNQKQKTCQQSQFQMKHTNTELEKAFLSAIILCG